MKKQFIICTLLLILCFALAIHTGLIGIDYGTHWDEGKLVWSVQNSVKTGLYLPRWYSYPSFSYDLALVTLVPEIYRVVSENRKAYKEAYSMSKHNEASVRKAVWKQVKTNFTDKLYQRAIQYRFWLNIRIVFLVVSMLSMLWIFFFQGFWQRNYIEALFASMLFGFSWEVGYHARWIAPDLIMTQFITLTMLFLILAYSNIAHKRLFMLLTSISAGIAIGTKYTSWIIIIPIIITFFLIKRREKGL